MPLSTDLIVGICVGSAVLLLLLLLLLLLRLIRRRDRQCDNNGSYPTSTPPPEIITSQPHIPSTGSPSTPPQSVSIETLTKDPSRGTFSYHALHVATDGFSDANLLGEDGFGYVHKGVLPNGKEVAVKQLKHTHAQSTSDEIAAQSTSDEIAAEMEIISKMHHKHLVLLMGYCITKDKRLLVYEFLPNKTLEFHLHERERPTMDWSARMRIALGAAKGLAYLHEDCRPKIVHGGLKAANILLNYKFEPKIADYGLVKFFPDENRKTTIQSMESSGYLAPESIEDGTITTKSDVFSFGIVLLELITGRRPVHKTTDPKGDKVFSLIDWATPLVNQVLEDDYYERLADPRMHGSYEADEMACMLACAAGCIRHYAKERPNMSQIVRVLEGAVPPEELTAGQLQDQGVFPRSRSASSTSSGFWSTQFSARTRRLQKTATFPSQDSQGEATANGGNHAALWRVVEDEREDYRE